MVQSPMFSRTQHLEILKPVVQLVAVDVMNVLISTKRPADVPLHNKSMIANTLPITTAPQIAKIIDTARPFFASHSVSRTVTFPSLPVGRAVSTSDVFGGTTRNRAFQRTELRLQDGCWIAVSAPARVVHLAPAARIYRPAASGNTTSLHTTKIITPASAEKPQ